MRAGGARDLRRALRRDDTDVGAAARRRMRVVATYATLAVLLAALVILNLSMGSVPIAPRDLAAALARTGQVDLYEQVIWTIRLPRLVAAGVLGGALALAGLLLQTLFANPIAGPYVLGISSGAKLAVAVLMIAVMGTTGALSSWMLVLAAFVGALGVTAVTLVVSRRVGTASMLIVAGVMIGYVCSAATDVLATFASDAHVVSLRTWSQGSFSGTNWHDVQVMSVVVAVASVCTYLLSKPMDAYQLGEDHARGVGVDVPSFRREVVVLSSVLAACVTAFAGPVSFVGVAVPHLVRRALATSRSLVVMPATFLGGSCFCLLCDLIARTAFAPTEMAVSTVTAILGAPVVISVMMRRRERVS